MFLYIDWLSVENNAAPATRNNRLAAIWVFISFAAACRPEYISIVSALTAIGVQKNDLFAKVDYMSEEAVKTLLVEPDTRTEIGVRDQFLMIFLYDTGLRIQEVLDVKICDIRVDRTPTVTLHGKGKKTRIVPLMKDTVKYLQNYMEIFHPGETWLSSEWLFYVERKGICKEKESNHGRDGFRPFPWIRIRYLYCR